MSCDCEVQSLCDKQTLVDDAATTMDELLNLSFECQWRRYESMLGASGRLIASLSLVLVALATCLPTLANIEKLGSCVVAELIFIFVLLALSLLLAVIAQYRFSYKGVPELREIVRCIEESRDKLSDRFDCKVYMYETLDAPYQSLIALNDRMGRLLRVANVFLAISIALIVLFVVIDAVVYLTIV